MSIVDELVTLLGFDLAPDAEGNARRYDEALVGLVKGAAAVGAALVTASGAVVAFARSQVTAIDESAEFAETIGLSYERMQELAFAAQMTGGSLQDLQSDLLRITATMGGPADEALGKLAKQFEGLDKAKQVELAKKLRLSPGTLRLLQSGARGIEDLSRQARTLGFVVSTDTAKAAAEFNDQMDILGMTVGAAGTRLAASLLPAMRKAVDLTLDWLQANAAWIDTGIGQVLDGVGEGFQMVGDAVSWAWSKVSELLPDIGGLSEGLDVTRVVAVAVAGALVLIAGALAVAAAPFVIITAKVLALLLVLEDLYTWFKGGDSIIGGWAQSLVRWLQPALDIINKVAEGFGAVARGVGRFATVVAGGRTAYTAPTPAGTVARVGAMGGGGGTQATIHVNGAGDPRAVADAVVERSGLGRAVQQSTPGRSGPVAG